MQQKYWLSLLLLLIPGVVFAQSGKIYGSVIDSKTKEPLIGANIIVEGTNIGAATNVDGTFQLINVPVGTYTLKATYIGYQNIVMSNIRVAQNYSTEANFALSSEDVQVQAVEIIAERPLVNKDYTNTLQVKTGEDIQTLPVRGVSNIIGLQASVVKNEATNQLYIRGGRAEEINVLIDGVPVVTPLNGQASAAFSNLNQNSIEELQVQTGGFNAEYGSAMSGQINVTTKQATSKYRISGEVITDGFIKPKVGENGGWGYNVYNMTVSGPVIPDNDFIKAFIGVERQYLGDNDPRAAGGYKANNTTKSWNLNGKFTIKPSKAIDVVIGGMSYAREGNQWDNYRRFYDAAHQMRFDYSTYTLFGRITHNIKSNFFYTFQVSYFEDYQIDGDPVFWDNLEAYGDPAQNPYLISTGTNPRDIYSVAAANGTVFNRFRRNETDQVTVNGDVNLQQGSHFIKAGFEYRGYLIRRYAIRPLRLAATALDPTIAFSEWQRYRDNGVEYYGYSYDGSVSDGDDWFGSRFEGPKEPIYWAAYLQDKIELSDLVLNLGFRVDYFDAKEQVVRDPNNPFGARSTGGVFQQSDLKPSTASVTVSPRLGFSFPVTDRAVLHAQYGTFLQMPPLQYVLISKTFEQYIMQVAPYSTQIPNPNLKPERTIAYEIGLRQLISDNAAFSFTGFYKEIKDLIQARNIGTNTNPAYPKSYETFENVDFGTVKGIDFILDLRRTQGISFALNYTLSYADGTGSDPTQQSNITWLQTESPKIISPLDYDRRHSGSLNVDYRTLTNEGPVIGGIYPFENTGINLLVSFNSGVPYTRSEVYNTLFNTVKIVPVEAINASTGPWNYRVDLRIDRSFKIGPVGLTASLYIINLTNAKNAYTVYRATGVADDSGWLSIQEGQTWAATYGAAGIQAYKAAEVDPTNYGVPRQIRIGLRAEY